MPVKRENFAFLLFLIFGIYHTTRTIIVNMGESLVGASSDDLFIKKSISKNVIMFKTDYTYKDFLEELGHEGEVVNSFIEILKTSNFEAYFFETPKITGNKLSSQKFEFVLVNAESLENVSPDKDAFQEHFSDCQRLVTKFHNLGGDSMLISPCPESSTNLEAYSHLAKFVRKAPQKQVLEFWKETSKTALKHIRSRGSKPTWMSTSGLGIYWLHLRLDSRPKYYTYQPYSL